MNERKTYNDMQEREVETVFVKGKEIQTLIVTRHPGLVEWLEKQGITGEVKSSVTVEDVRGKHVVGALPAHIAQWAEYVTSVDYICPLEFRGKELSAEQLETWGAKLFDYRVVPVVWTRLN